MAKPNKVIVTDRVRVPKHLIAASDIKDRYVIDLYRDSKCNTCANLPDRAPDNELCSNCEFCFGSHRFYNSKEAKQGIWSLPQADSNNIRAFLKKSGQDFKWVDRRVEHLMSTAFRFTGSLYKFGDKDDFGNPRADQVSVVEKWMKKKNGKIVARARSGKCLRGDSMVNTNLGFVEMRELVSKKGYDSHSGNISTHKGSQPISHTYKSTSFTHRIVTEHGNLIEGTPEHPVLVFTSDLRFLWKHLNEIQEGDYVVTGSKESQPIWPSSDRLSKHEARFLGYMVANGSAGGMHSEDFEVIKDFRDCCYAIFGEYPKRVLSNNKTTAYVPPKGFLTYFYVHGFPRHGSGRPSSKKTIPLAVRQSSREIMVEFLSAYFMCDSTKNGEEINLSSASRKLMTQMHTILWQGFGIQGYLKSKIKHASNSNNPKEQRYWFIRIANGDARQFLDTFKSKVAKYTNQLSYGGTNQDYRYKAIPYIQEYYAKTISNYFVKKGKNFSNLYRYRDGSIRRANVWIGFGPRRVKHLASKKSIEKITEDIWQDIKEMDGQLYKRMRRVIDGEFTFSKVISSKATKTKKTVYDLTVPKLHAYYANGVVCHNTVIATNIYCQLGVKTVIIAGKRALLNQFYESACGVPAPRYLRGKFVKSMHKAQRPAMTNIPAKQQKTGKQIIFMPESYKQLTDYLSKEIPDILLITYQSFIKDSTRVAEVINKYYSFAIIDEEHRAGADAYLRFAASIDVKYRLGLTATPDRKDGRSRLTQLIMGSVVAQTAVSTLKPQIEYYPVKAKPKIAHKSWHGAKKWMKTNAQRNAEIVQLAFKDMREGYDVIVIPVEHKDHLEYLVNLINHQAKLNAKKRDEEWPVPLARGYYRGVDEVETLSWVDSRDKHELVKKGLPTKSPRILVAIMSMIREGVDMKRPSMLYSTIPASAEYKVGAPQIEQLATRVATPYPKLQPIVRVFVDNIGMFASCASSLLYQEFLPKSDIKMKGEAVYKLPNYGQAKVIVSQRTSKSALSGNPSDSFW